MCKVISKKLEISLLYRDNEWSIKVYNPLTNSFIDKTINVNAVSALLYGINCDIEDINRGYKFHII